MEYIEEKTGLLVRLAGDDTFSQAERHRAFGVLVVRFQDLVFGCAYALSGDPALAEEAAQESFILAWRHLAQLREPDAFPGWLKRIVVSRTRRLVEQRQRVGMSVAISSIINVPAPEHSPEEQLLRAERTTQVRAAVAVLPENERLVVILFYVGGYSRQEVAVFLNISAVMVKKRLAAARSRLKERFLVNMQEDLLNIRPSNSDGFATRILGFTKLFSALVDSGVPLLKTMDRLIEQEEDNEFRAAIVQIRSDLTQGACLSQAMRPHPQFFSERYIAEVRAGEVSGELEVALNRLVEGEII